MAWGQTSWDDADPPPGGDFDNNEARRFWMPKGLVKRIMFLESAPFCCFEHSLYSYTRSGKDRAICLQKNKIGEGVCAVCDDGQWPSFVGFFSTIDLGDVTYGDDGAANLQGYLSQKGVLWQFQRKVYVTKRGGEDRPGMLVEFKKQGKRRGGLLGCVFDVQRRGDQSEVCGDSIEFIDKIPQARFAEYIKSLGGDDSRIPDGSIVFDPFDWATAIKIPTPEQLANVIGKPSVSETPQAGVQGAGYGEEPTDKPDSGFPSGDSLPPPEDDIPF